MDQRKYKTLKTEKSRITRAKEHTESSKNHRAKTFDNNRNLSNSSMNTQEAQINLAVQDRLARLQKWKAERNERKKIEQRKKKQPFVVGIVHHKTYSPLNKYTATKSTITSNIPSTVKKISKATEKRLMYKASQKNLSAENANKNSNKLNKDSNELNKNRKRKSFAPEDHIFKAPAGLPSIPLFGRAVIQSTSPDSVQQFLHPTLKMTRSRSSVIEDNSTEFIKKENCSSMTKTNDNSIESTSLKLLLKDTETTNSVSNTSSNDNEVMTENKMSSSDDNKSMSVQSNSPCETFFSPHSC